MYKTAIARQKRNKKIYKKLSISLRKIARKSKKYFVFEKVLFKFAPATLLIMGMLVFNIYPTNAFFNDRENSTDNTFSAGLLDIDISGKTISGIVLPDNATTTTITLSKSTLTSLDYQYFASSTILDADQTACSYVTILASSLPQNYPTRPLKNFISATSSPTGSVLWDFTLAVVSGVPVTDLGKICNFKISYIAWQTDLPDSSQGFSDIEEMAGSIQIGLTPTVPVAPNVVLNEFLPNPDGILCTDGGSSCAPGDSNFIFDFGSDSDDMPQGEWVELYNNGNMDVDLTGWYLRDSTNGEGNKTPINNSHILVSSPIIPAHGWLVVYMNKAIYNNPGDTVRLFNKNGTLIDSYSYGVDSTFCDMEPTPNANNDTSGSGSCNNSNVPGNKSFARIPDGTGAWIDPIPTPGEPNKIEENVGGGSGTLSITATATDNSATSTTATTTPETSTTPEIATSTDQTISDSNVITTVPSSEPAPQSAPVPELTLEPAVLPPEPEGPVTDPTSSADSGQTNLPQTEPAIVESAPIIESAPAAEAPAPELPPSQ